MHVQLGHQERVQHAKRSSSKCTTTVRPDGECREEIAPAHEERAAVAHVNREGPERHRAVNVAKLLERHSPILRLNYCKFTGMITYRKFGPPRSSPGRFGAVSSSEISSLSTTRSASVRNVGLKPISTSAPSYLHAKFTSASPASGLRLVSFKPFFVNARRTPLLSSVVKSEARFTAERKSAVPATIFLSVSFGITSSYGGNCPSTRLLVSVALLVWKMTWFSRTWKLTASSGSSISLSMRFSALAGTIALAPSLGSLSETRSPLAWARRRPSVLIRLIFLPFATISTPLNA